MTNQNYASGGSGSSERLTSFTGPYILFFMKTIDPIILDVYRAYGTAANLAKVLGVTRQAVHQWHKVPLKYVRRISSFTGIPPAVLRPDIYAEI